MTFKELNITEPILKAIEEKGYTVPTPIQEKAIPVALAKKDILGCAQTGTGKTASFAIPIYKRQNKLFHFHKTFCSEFDIINTKQNVHFTKVVSPIYQFCLSLHQFSIGAKAPFIIKEISTTASS